jgi:Skp family chaperone for outer membrane proteins
MINNTVMRGIGRATKVVLLFILLFFILNNNIRAQQPSGSNDSDAVHFIVVDVQNLLQNSLAEKDVRAQVETKRAEYAKAIANREATLRRERDALQAQQLNLSAAQLTAKGKAFQAEVDELDSDVNSLRKGLETANAAALQIIKDQIAKIITGLAKERKPYMVLNRSEMVLIDHGYYVTDKVLEKLNQDLQGVKVNFGNPTVSSAMSSALNK